MMTAFYYFADLLVRESDAQPATFQIFKDKAAQLQAEIEGVLPAELRAAAIARGQNCTLKEMAATLLAAMAVESLARVI